MLLLDVRTDQPRFLGLGCRVMGNQIICTGVALNDDVSGETLEAQYGDNLVTIKAPPIPRTDNLYHRYVEEMAFEIKAVSR